MSAHRAWEPTRAGRVGVPTVLSAFPHVRTPAVIRVRLTEIRRGTHYRVQAARAAAWQADQLAGAR